MNGTITSTGFLQEGEPLTLNLVAEDDTVIATVTLSPQEARSLLDAAEAHEMPLEAFIVKVLEEELHQDLSSRENPSQD